MGVSISLTGKNAIITGGGDGIGKVTARMIAEAGADVFIADLNLDNAINTADEIRKEFGVKAYSCKCNVASKAEVDAMVAEAVNKMGRIDILNHIAGVSKKVDYLEITEETYDFIMDINAKGTFFVDQAVLKVMIPNGSGKIVNMSSMSGKEGYPTNVAYSASKFAVMGITQAVAKYAAPHNINVNAVCPGIVPTHIWDKIISENPDPEAYWNDRVSSIPLKRVQTKEDVAHMVLYLSSSFADNMTGQGINVTGGIILH